MGELADEAPVGPGSPRKCRAVILALMKRILWCLRSAWAKGVLPIANDAGLARLGARW